MSIKLGNKVRCKISGFEGIATAKVEYINGCTQYCIAPRSKDNNIPENQYIDIQQLEVVDEGVTLGSKPTGGHNQYQPR